MCRTKQPQNASGQKTKKSKIKCNWIVSLPNNIVKTAQRLLKWQPTLPQTWHPLKSPPGSLCGLTAVAFPAFTLVCEIQKGVQVK
jgi:hypothetical protein